MLLFLLFCVQLQKQVQDLNDQLRDKEHDLVELLQRKKKAEKEAKDMEANFTRDVRLLETQLVSLRDELMREKHRADTTIHGLNQKLNESLSREAQLQSELDAAQQRIAEAPAPSSGSAAVDRSAYDAKLDEMRKRHASERATLMTRIEQLTAANQALQKELEAAKKSIRKRDEEIEDLRKKLESFKEVGKNLRAVIEKEKDKKLKARESAAREKQQPQQQIKKKRFVDEAAANLPTSWTNSSFSFVNDSMCSFIKASVAIGIDRYDQSSTINNK